MCKKIKFLFSKIRKSIKTPKITIKSEKFRYFFHRNGFRIVQNLFQNEYHDFEIFSHYYFAQGM